MRFMPYVFGTREKWRVISTGTVRPPRETLPDQLVLSRNSKNFWMKRPDDKAVSAQQDHTQNVPSLPM